MVYRLVVSRLALIVVTIIYSVIIYRCCICNTIQGWHIALYICVIGGVIGYFIALLLSYIMRILLVYIASVSGGAVYLRLILVDVNAYLSIDCSSEF